MKLVLILISLLILYKGVVSTGDPGGFYSSAGIFYAMLMLDYYNDRPEYTSGFLKFGRGVMGALTLVSVAGILDILTIKKFGDTFYMAFSEDIGLSFLKVSVHKVFLTMVGFAFFIAALEYVVGIFAKKQGNNTIQGRLRKKGA